MRWSPFLPLDSGVSPLPHFSQASIDLQIWMPRSFTILVFTTLLPLASIICARLQPSRLLRTCPKWRGLLVLGDEYSIITSGLLSSACFSPKWSSVSMVLSRLSHASWAMTRLRNPFTTLYAATAGHFSTKYCPISSATSSGFFLAIFTKGNTTRVRLPSNSFFVFCSCTIFSGTSWP